MPSLVFLYSIAYVYGRTGVAVTLGFAGLITLLLTLKDRTIAGLWELRHPLYGKAS